MRQQSRWDNIMLVQSEVLSHALLQFLDADRINVVILAKWYSGDVREGARDNSHSYVDFIFHAILHNGEVRHGPP